jgi:hypothetical protein
MGSRNYTRFNIFIIFSRLLKYFWIMQYKVASMHICRIIKDFWDLCIKNIPKDYHVFSFIIFFFQRNKIEIYFFIDNIINSKVLQ